MPTVDYIPSADATRIVWFNNFATKFVQYMAQLGIAAADVAVANTDSTTLTYAEGSPVPLALVAPTIVPPVPIAAPGIVARTRALVRRIKASPVYNSSTVTSSGSETRARSDDLYKLV